MCNFIFIFNFWNLLWGGKNLLDIFGFISWIIEFIENHTLRVMPIFVLPSPSSLFLMSHNVIFYMKRRPYFPRVNITSNSCQKLILLANPTMKWIPEVVSNLKRLFSVLFWCNTMDRDKFLSISVELFNRCFVIWLLLESTWLIWLFSRPLTYIFGLETAI